MEHLMLRLIPANDAFLAEWALWRAESCVASSENAEALDQIVPRLPEAQTNQRQIVILVPSQNVVLTQVEVPANQSRHYEKIVPFLLEDQLAEDIQLLHIALGGKIDGQGRIEVAIVRRQLLQTWLDALDVAGIHPNVVIPESLALPVSEVGWSLVSDGHSVWLRISPSIAYAVDDSMVTDFLESMLLNYKGVSLTVEAYITIEGQSLGVATALDQWAHAHPSVVLRWYEVSSVMQCWCESYHQNHARNHAAINLLQGEFTPRALQSYGVEGIRKLTKVVLVFFVLMTALLWGEQRYYTYKAGQWRSEAIALYQQLFPQDKKIVNPVAQMKNHLSLTSKQSGNSFLGLMATLQANWKSDDAVEQVKSIQFEQADRHLKIILSASSMKTLNGLVQRLNQSGIAIQIASVNREDDHVVGQLMISGEVP